MDVTIRFAETQAEREAVYRLRYIIYVEELGATSMVEADHVMRWLDEGGVQNSRLLYAKVNDDLVATLRLQLGADNALREEEAITYELARFEGVVDIDQICVLSRFMALQGYRGSVVPQLMLQAMYRFCVAEGLSVCLLDCRPHLLNLYTGLGFRTYCRPYSEPDYGLLIPMILLIRDREHLATIKSPFLPDAPVDGSDPHKALIALVQQGAGAVTLTDAVPANGAPLLGLADEGRVPVALFADMSEAEVARVIGHGHQLTCRRDDKLIIEGDVEHTMFLILHGHVEARVGGRVVGVEGPGSVIGEVAYLLGGARTADIVASEDGVRVLYLRRRALQDLMDSEPHLAARLLLNLSRILATKYLAKYR